MSRNVKNKTSNKITMFTLKSYIAKYNSLTFKVKRKTKDKFFMTNSKTKQVVSAYFFVVNIKIAVVFMNFIDNLKLYMYTFQTRNKKRKFV